MSESPDSGESPSSGSYRSRSRRSSSSSIIMINPTFIIQSDDDISSHRSHRGESPGDGGESPTTSSPKRKY